MPMTELLLEIVYLHPPRWTTRHDSNWVRVKKKYTWSKNPRRDAADAFVDHLCGLPFDEEKFKSVNITFPTLRRHLKYRYELLCSGTENVNEDHKQALKAFL